MTTRPKKEAKPEGESEGGRPDENDDTEQTLASDELDEVVFKLVDGKAVKTIVKTGISDFERIEVIEGIAEGDEIISGPFLAVSKRLKDGDGVEANGGEKDEEDKTSSED